MIRTKTDAKKTQITICNYSRYQDVGRKEDADGTQTGRREDAQKTPIHQYTNTPVSSSLRSDDKPVSDLGGFKDELSTVISTDRIDAIVGQRRKKKAAVTQHAGRLLANNLRECPNPNEAADEMILRNWTSVKPEWLEPRNQHGKSQKQNDTTLKALDRMIENERPDIFDALKTIDYQDDRNGGSSSLARLPAHAQRY
jgi:hypothetical protein